MKGKEVSEDQGHARADCDSCDRRSSAVGLSNSSISSISSSSVEDWSTHHCLMVHLDHLVSCVDLLTAVSRGLQTDR